MPSFNSHSLLKTLERDIQTMLKEIAPLQALSQETLNRPPHAGKWSIAQIIEHLNSYNRYYIPQIQSVLKKGEEKKVKPNSQFNTGVIGGYFTNMMMPKENGKMRRMPAPQDHVPKRILDGQKVLADFIETQTQLVALLQEASKTDLQKLKVSVSISKWMKLRLGDTFRFLIAHQQRHFRQLHTAVKQVKATESLLRMVA